jgi:hypothetical protein
MKIHNFSNSNNVGKLGEAVFHQILQKSGLKNIQDVTSKKTYQAKGIDFLVGDIGIDVKLDIQTDKTGYIAIEKVSKKQDGVVIKQGWAYTSEAHLIAYMFMDTKSFEWVIFFFTPEEARGLIDEYENVPYAIKSSQNYGYESVIVRIPVSEIKFKILRLPIVGDFDFFFLKKVMLG